MSQDQTRQPQESRPAPAGAGSSPSGRGRSRRSGIHLALIVLFLLALWLPRLEMSLHLFPAVDIAEKGPPVVAPPLTWRGLPAFFRGYEAYYGKVFGLRDLLVHWDSRVRLKVLRTLPISKLVVGREGWIFYASEKVRDGITMADHKGLVPYSPEQLDGIARNLRGRVRWCRERGAECLFVVVPNKETIYPEFLPSSVRRIGFHTRLGQVVDALGSRSGVPLLDLRPALLEAKAECRYPLYNRGGTHWNQYGAYYGYREVVRTLARLYPGLDPYDLTDFLIVGDPRSADDHWLGLKENYRFDFTLKPESVRDDAGGGVGKVVVLHDSFWVSLEPFFALHFPDMAVQHYSPGRDQNAGFVEREKPALIVYEVAERYADAWWGW